MTFSNHPIFFSLNVKPSPVASNTWYSAACVSRKVSYALREAQKSKVK